jgi:uncharacterized protein (TIGR02453 family)
MGTEATAFDGFPTDTEHFLSEVALHNDKTWFDANRKRFEANVQAPALAFVRALAPRLARISNEIAADDRKSGGSMMRFFRDTRFSKDKSPYNTHLSFQFAHRAGKGSVAPGFYARIEPGRMTVGTGVWQPATPDALRIRTHIDENAKAWIRARDDRAFRATFGELGGESLKRVPKEFAADHPLADDLRRKDFVAFAELDAALVKSPELPDAVAAAYTASKPFVAFLCAALGQPF